jgi:hypothetical protein
LRLFINLQGSVADPDSGAFLPPGSRSGIHFSGSWMN